MREENNEKNIKSAVGGNNNNIESCNNNIESSTLTNNPNINDSINQNVKNVALLCENNCDDDEEAVSQTQKEEDKFYKKEQNGAMSPQIMTTTQRSDVCDIDIDEENECRHRVTPPCQSTIDVIL